MPQVVDRVSSEPVKLKPAQKKSSPSPKSEKSDAGQPQTFEQALEDATPKAKTPDPESNKPESNTEPPQKQPACADDVPAEEGEPTQPTPEAAASQNTATLPELPPADGRSTDKPVVDTEKKQQPTDSEETQPLDPSLTAQQAAAAPTPVESAGKTQRATDEHVESAHATPAAQAAPKPLVKKTAQAQTQELPNAGKVSREADQRILESSEEIDVPDPAKAQTPPRQTQAVQKAPAKPQDVEKSEPLVDPIKAAAPKSTETALAVPPDTAAPAQPAPAETDSMEDRSSRPAAAIDLKIDISDAPATKPTLQEPAQMKALPGPAPQPTPAPELDFANTNHDRIVSSIRGELLPNGGTMHIRLDPPELGALQVTVRMLDGVMTASFETSTDQATKLLSHSLGQLRTALETQGVSVERLHVQQSPRDQQSGSSSDDQQQRQSHQQDQSARQEQQRKEMLRRMWARLGYLQDPLDMVA
jgi:flagellar hook-length control protein FliK